MSEAENFEAAEEVATDQTALLQQRCIKYIVFSGLLGFIMLLALAALISTLVFAHSRINAQQQSLPWQAIDEVATTIANDIETIKAEHQEHKAFLKGYEVLPLIERQPHFFEAMMDSEKQQGDYIKHYQGLIYELASRVRGSGEWYSFFNRQLDYYYQRCQNRSRYLKKLEPTVAKKEMKTL